MNINEEQLKREIREGIERSNKTVLIKLLRYCYHYSDDDLQDAEPHHNVGRGEAVAASGSFDEIFEHLQYELRTKGRHFALTWILGNLFFYFGNDKRHQLLTMVEICEVDERVDNDQFIEANIRLCSYLENLLKERNEEQDRNLYYRIQTARDENVLTKEQEMLAQFVRDVRNDAAHNFWLETEWSFVIHEFAGIAGVTLLNEMLNNLGVLSWSVEPDLEVDNVFRVIEGEFGFEWDKSEREWSNNPRERYVRNYEWTPE